MFEEGDILVLDKNPKWGGLSGNKFVVGDIYMHGYTTLIDFTTGISYLWCTEAVNKSFKKQPKENKMNTLNKGKFIIGTIGNKAAGLREGEVHVAKNPKEHDFLADAKNEAERLAKANKGTSFVVLEVKGIVAVEAVNWR